MKKLLQRKARTLLNLNLIILLCLMMTVPVAAATSWTKVNENGFGNPDNWGTRSLVKFKDKLYAFTDSGIYRTENDTGWSQVGENMSGIGAAFKGMLYRIIEEEIWRSPDGGNWTKAAE